MQKTKMTVVSNLMLNVHPGVELEVIVDGDVVYAPVMSLPNLQEGSRPALKKVEEAAPEAAKTAPAKTEAAPATKEKAAPASQETYSEEDLKALPSDDVREIALGMGIDVDAEFEKSGSKRMTNKFLRELVLGAQKSAAPAPAAGKAAPVTEEKAEDLSDDELANLLKEKVVGTLTALENEEITEAAALNELADLTFANFDLSDEEKDDVKADIKESVITVFLEDVDKPIEEIADIFVDVAFGDEDEEQEEDGGGVDYDSLPAVKPETLKKGQKVAVFWNDGQGWAEGEVTAVSRRGGPTITYTDGESDKVNKLTTKFVLL